MDKIAACRIKLLQDAQLPAQHAAEETKEVTERSCNGHGLALA